MHTVDALEEALKLAERLGYQLRQEWLGGSGGGDCEVKGRKWLFLDLALAPIEQLEHVLDTLRREPAAYSMAMPEPLRRMLGQRKAA